jgi:hypothetical protein
LLAPIQKLDTLNELGKRDAQLPKNKQLLAGSLTKKTPLIRCFGRRYQYLISRADLSARVDIPASEPQINFFPRNGSVENILVA